MIFTIVHLFWQGKNRAKWYSCAESQEMCSMCHLEKTILESGETMPRKISVCLDMLQLMRYVTKNHVQKE